MSNRPANLTEGNTTKLWDRRRPFHRINCPAEIYGGERPGGDVPVNGQGFHCGCRDPDRDMPEGTPEQNAEDLSEAVLVGLIGAVAVGLVGAALGAGIGALVGLEKDTVEESAKKGALYGAAIGAAVGFVGGMVSWLLLKDHATKQLLRTLPSWVHVEGSRDKLEVLESEVEREVEGILTESFQTWTDMPLYQFHRYFDWNFYLTADPGYRYIGGRGNESERHPDAVIECEWDIGAFAGLSPTNVGGLYCGADLGWPMSGQLIWIAGRWIYDCGHGAPNREWEALPEAERQARINDSQLMRAELHPIKAIATARWQGVSFDRNHGNYVPGIRFVFFASKRGGYVDFPTLGGKDYEFIVDVPRHPAESVMDFVVEDSSEHAGSKTVKGRGMGRHAIPTQDEGGGRVHLRRTELLIRIDSEPFGHEGFGRRANVTPVVEPVMDASGAFCSQVKVTIPLSQAADDDDFYGVHIELGWLDDANLTLAREVRKVTVTFESVQKLNVSHDFGSEEWRMRFGANGHWFQTPETELGSMERVGLGGEQLTVFLGPNDPLTIATHGTEHNVVEDKFRESDADRTIMLDGAPVDYLGDIVGGDPHKRRRISREVFQMLMWSFGDTSAPLGRVHEIHRQPDLDLDREPRYRATGIALVEDEHLAETYENPEKNGDFVLQYTLKMEEQTLRGS